MSGKEERKSGDGGDAAASSKFGAYGAAEAAAATKLQNLFRSRKSRKLIQVLLKSVYEKVYDVSFLESGVYADRVQGRL